jgi:hypothetical protein
MLCLLFPEMPGSRLQKGFFGKLFVLKVGFLSRWLCCFSPPCSFGFPVCVGVMLLEFCASCPEIGDPKEKRLTCVELGWV